VAEGALLRRMRTHYPSSRYLVRVEALDRHSAGNYVGVLASPVKKLSAMTGVVNKGWDGNVHLGYLQQLAVGNGYTLVLVGTPVKAIGLNTTGQLGDGTLTSRRGPTNVCLPRL
jgi:hypothetical protein